MIPPEHKRGGRGVRESVRTLALERVREGERPGEVMASYGFHRCTLYNWLRAERGRGGMAVPGGLSLGQERQLFRLVNGKCPCVYGLDGGLWGLSNLGELVAARFGQRLPPDQLEDSLRRLGLSPAVDGLRRREFQACAHQARRAQAELCYWHDGGVHRAALGDAVAAHDAVPERGHIVRKATAVNADGEFWFATYADALSSRLLVDLLRRLMRRRERPLHLLLDGQPVQRSPVVMDYVDGLRGRLVLHFPPSAPAARNAGAR